jgi:hypothetical protein
MYVYIWRQRENMIVMIGLRGLKGDRRGKENDRVNNTETHCICV